MRVHLETVLTEISAFKLRKHFFICPKLIKRRGCILIVNTAVTVRRYWSRIVLFPDDASDRRQIIAEVILKQPQLQLT